jgi:hypothetical protein
LAVRKDMAEGLKAHQVAKMGGISAIANRNLRWAPELAEMRAGG